MGIFDFLKDSGEKTQGNTPDEIKQKVAAALQSQVDPLYVSVDDNSVVHLGGMAVDRAAWEKAILVAGNIQGVARVNSQHLKFPAPEPEPKFYTIQSGDSLSKIAKEQCGDTSKWRALFEANKEVIKDPDKIYPGQQIRIPDDL
jgi:nucleoid-associated protein YgaU